MKIVIFAGGAGTRLWPLSRRKSPKQFEKIIGDKSTLQLCYERLKPTFSSEDIFVATNILYKEIVYNQLPQIPKKNFIFEPEKKDVGPAIALVMGLFSKLYPNEPIAILWSDHLVKQADIFRKILYKAGNYIKKNPDKIIFIAHYPRFPSTNLGYIKIGKKKVKIDNLNCYNFLAFKYKPDEVTAKRYFKSGNYAWNLGYFITNPVFLYKQYSVLTPNVYRLVDKILESYGKKDYPKVLEKHYSKIESISFDQAIAERIDRKNALVIVEDIGWSDIGAWEALKESLEKHQYENVIRGRVHLEGVKDSLIYNYEDNKLIVGLDFDDLIVVNTNDVTLIAKKTSISKLSQLIKNFEGTENEKLT